MMVDHVGRLNDGLIYQISKHYSTREPAGEALGSSENTLALRVTLVVTYVASATNGWLSGYD